ncbi:histone deacetylase family protein [Aliikangiella sp. IMCC44359]|uniref:histone deacetylase family protein n=1 Tax=Aliikangiella sp. IMCC44359 TaxID=3459125 RepID=UPI00403AA047
MIPHFIYSNNYDFSLLGVDKFHPFDSKKFSKAWRLFSEKFTPKADFKWIEPDNMVSDKTLLNVHSQKYLNSLSKSKNIAQVIEVYSSRFVPSTLLIKGLLNPIKYACQGTIIATELALKEHTIVMNFGGGYHHAFSDHGEGFCFFADAVISIVEMRNKGLLGENDKVMMIDLDAHRGNGFEELTKHDSAISNFDMYNLHAYPGIHFGDPDDFPFMIPLQPKMRDERYFKLLEEHLDKFLDSQVEPKLIFYNAGNDILETDPLGGLSVSYDGVVRRDKFIIEKLIERNIPTVVMTSGGYTEKSCEIIAELASSIVGVTKNKYRQR